MNTYKLTAVINYKRSYEIISREISADNFTEALSIASNYFDDDDIIAVDYQLTLSTNN